MKFKSADFRPMDQADHKQRCTSLKNVTKAAKAYWSKMWGTNKESCLARIPDFLNVTLLHYPMLLEGVIPYELQLFLFHAITTEKYFTLEWLNAALCRFAYTYLD